MGIPTQYLGPGGFKERYLRYLTHKVGIDLPGTDENYNYDEDIYMSRFIETLTAQRYKTILQAYAPPYSFIFSEPIRAYEQTALEIEGEITANTSPLASINSAATNFQDISTFPYVADCNLYVEPCAKLIEMPMFSKTIRTYDNPPNGVTVNPFQYLDNSAKVGFELRYDGFTADSLRFPEPITQKDVTMRDAYMNSIDYGFSPLPASASPQRLLEVYRIDKRPSKYTDFGESLIATVDLQIESSNYNQINTIVTNELELNKKYYFVFRFVNENGIPGYPSRILETELINDGGYTYANFDTMTPDEVELSPDTIPSKAVRRLLQIIPSTNQLRFDDAQVDYTGTANQALSAGTIKLGPSITERDDSASVWGKTFKIRLISKKSGKKIDINVTYDVGIQGAPTEFEYVAPFPSGHEPIADLDYVVPSLAPGGTTTTGGD
jgi:hypothetical protein